MHFKFIVVCLQFSCHLTHIIYARNIILVHLNENLQITQSVLDLLAEDCVRLCAFGDVNLPLLNWDLFVYPDNHLYCTAADF